MPEQPPADTRGVSHVPENELDRLIPRVELAVKFLPVAARGKQPLVPLDAFPMHA